MFLSKLLVAFGGLIWFAGKEIEIGPTSQNNFGKLFKRWFPLFNCQCVKSDQIGPMWIYAGSQVSVNKRRSVSVWKAAGRLCFCCWKERESNHCITATLNCTLQCVCLSLNFIVQNCAATLQRTAHDTLYPSQHCAVHSCVLCTVHFTLANATCGRILSATQHFIVLECTIHCVV